MKRLLLCLIIAALLCGCTYNKNEYTDTRLLMDTVCTIKAGGAEAEAAVAEAFAETEEIAARTNYYSDSSDVCKINNAAANEAVKVSAHTMKILETALEIYKASDGAFDVTIAPVKDLWQFNTDKHNVPDYDSIQKELKRVDSGRLRLDADAMTVTKTDSDVKIDLGGCAKGYAADRAAEILKEKNAEYAVIDFGGNIFVLGKNPKSRDGSFNIGIRKAFSADESCAATVNEKEGAVVTSGIYQRYFEEGGKLYHHIIDTRTGYPTDNGITGVSVRCKSSLTADCLATACVVMGEDAGKALCEKYNAEIVNVQKQ